MKTHHGKTAFVCGALVLALLVLPVAAAQIPAQLPAPDGKPGDAAKPVKVYLLAGQSNMVGMGDIAGARNLYTGVYLTADPAAPTGPLTIWRVGNYLIRRHGVYVSAGAGAASGAVASVYSGAYNPATDYDNANPAKTQTIPLGVVKATLPSIADPHTVVVRGAIDVPQSGNYTLNPGHGDSTCNVTELDGKEVYRKDPGGEAVKQKVALEAGKRYPLQITYFKGGSTALWLSQEDLQGNGDLGTVTKRDKHFPYLLDEKGNWTVRNDVYFYDARIHFKGSPLSATSNGKSIGPEVGFGYVMGTFHDEQVLLIKTSMGNRSIGFDFRPPSSGRTDPNSKWEGLEYRLMVEGVRKTLAQIDKIVPGYKGQGYEMAGFVWWQGHKDSFSEETISGYEKNLVNMIQDVRKEFKAPKMPAVVATVGFGGHRMAEKFLRILKAQMAVGDPKKHPEFAGTVASVDIRDFWREVDESPRSQDYHYNRNAETYMLVGEALGRAMVGLLGGTAEPISQAFRRKTAPPQTSSDPERWKAPAAREALRPIIMEGIAPTYVANPRYNKSLLQEARGERPQRVNQFLQGAMYGLINCYNTVGVSDYDWHAFGPDLKNVKWDYFSFDPPEALPKDKGNRYRKVTYPKGMEDWAAPDFDARKAGWEGGLPPFGQLDGKLAPLGQCDYSGGSRCGCGVAPRSLWAKEVLLIRGTFEFPPLKEGHRYRIVVGGSAHVNAGEGFAIYINGKQLIESKSGVGKRQGGQPRGGHIYADFRDEFKGGKVTIAATSFLRYNHPRTKPYPPRGHFTLLMEEQKIPPLGK